MYDGQKNVLDKTGGFDEQFFMYGEDIDLSYRISQAGFRNYYFPGTTIIHFKGESTPKNRRYIKMFYDAMALFIKKHFRDYRLDLQLLLIKSGVRIHQAFAFIRIFFRKSAVHKRRTPSIYIKGTPSQQNEWKECLNKKNIPVTDNENEAEEIIFCEGPELTWKSIISRMSANGNRMLYKVHGSGTHSAVGSYSSQEQGVFFELKNTERIHS